MKCSVVKEKDRFDRKIEVIATSTTGRSCLRRHCTVVSENPLLTLFRQWSITSSAVRA